MAQTAVNAFQASDQSLTDIANSLTGQITGSVQTVNTYATQIANLNTTIKSAIATGQGQQPNDLLDQRDQLVNLLNKEVKVSVQQQTDGSMSVFVGSGQALVVGDQAMALQVVQNPLDSNKVDVAYFNNGKTVTLQQSSLQGGNLGAYLTFRDQNLEPARNALGRVAMAFASNINQQNQLGQDLNGVPGSSLLSSVAPRVGKGANNTGNASIAGTITNVAALTTSDYQVKFDGANYTMTRMSDNVVTNLGANISSSSVDGFSLTLVSGAMNPGDSFLIRPTANAARDIAVMTNDPAKIATALPFRGSASISATNAANITTVVSGAITDSAVTVAGTGASTDTFTVDGKTLLTSTVAAGATGPLLTAANLDTAWTTFAAANPGYTLTGTFTAGTAQITKAGGAAIVLAEALTTGTGATVTPFSAATPGFIGTTPGSTVSLITGITISTPGDPNLKNPVAITFTSPTTYTVTGAVPAVAGAQTFTPPNISYNGWTMQLNGATPPAAGDVLNVGANSGTGKVSSGTYNMNPVSISFTSATAYNVVEMRGVPPTAVTLGTGTYTSGAPISYNGWTANISGTPVTGDTFNITKGSNAASMLLSAAAGNSNGASISGGALSVQPFSIMFSNPPTSYTVTGATPTPVPNPVAYAAGQDISYNGWTMQVTGNPVAGDVFNVAPNTTATGDNRNALLMAGQQTQNLLINGTATIQGAFSQLVGSVGAKTQELTITSQAQDAMVTQTVAAQQSVSGVNLDEEAANLLRYQRAYQAAAKAMQIANTMFDSLLTLGR
jgi:flagellar hook-associated protein 1 FlgK